MSVLEKAMFTNTNPALLAVTSLAFLVSACDHEQKPVKGTRIYSEMVFLVTCIKAFHKEHGSWPTTPDDYIEMEGGRTLRDPWNTEYRITWMPPDRYLLQSGGQDCEFDTADDRLVLFRIGREISPVFVAD